VGDGSCPPVVTSEVEVLTRCNGEGMCQEVRPAPHSGAHYFYSVTATDHKLDDPNEDGVWDIVGPGLAGDPSSNFVYNNRRRTWNRGSTTLRTGSMSCRTRRRRILERLGCGRQRRSTGVKIEFRSSARKQGMVTIYTLSGDMVISCLSMARRAMVP
jgi:hypothetical protein